MTVMPKIMTTINRYRSRELKLQSFNDPTRKEVIKIQIGRCIIYSE
jgi:hypothetical protein